MRLRQGALERLQSEAFDVLILGGGINGAVSAAALSAAGARVALIDRDDFASATSSNSSNLVWGGIKYLESGEWWLVNTLCRSRNRLLRAYPSTVREIRFLAAIEQGFRWSPRMLRLGTLAYWLIGRCATRAPEWLSCAALGAREPMLRPGLWRGGLEYSDCYLQDNDARFVFGFIRRALDQGCAAANYVEALGASRDADGWQVPVCDRVSGAQWTLKARVLINACGPWVDGFNQHSGQATAHRHLYSKGVHLIVDRISPAARVLTFFASDGRLFFVMPMGNKTCIGTTDTQVRGPDARVSASDRQFILDNANRVLQLPQPLGPEDVIAERCGVRPLAVRDNKEAVRGGETESADWLRLSRRHVIEVDRDRALLSIFGGKLTDCLNVGDEVVETLVELGQALPQRDRPWFGEPDSACHQRFLAAARRVGLDARTPAGWSEPLSVMLWRRHGEAAMALLEGLAQHPDWAEPLIDGAELIRGELKLAAEREMVTRLEDWLRRRTLISQQVRPAVLLASAGLAEACQILFGDQAEAQLQAYRQAQSGAGD